MLMPSGEEAYDALATERSTHGGKRVEDFKKVFEPSKGGGIAFAGARCEKKGYVDDIRNLMTRYEKSPYPRVALADCLKRLGDTNWKKEAALAKIDLEFYMSIEPHVITIDGFYGMLMKYVLDDKTNLEDTGFFIVTEGKVYRPKNMPP
jgi:hypothetical protein